MGTTSLVSYVPKNNKNVLLMSTLPPPTQSQRTDSPVGMISDLRDRKLELVLRYSSIKGRVDNLDKVITMYSYRKMTARWTLVVFHNILNVSAYNAILGRLTRGGCPEIGTRGGCTLSSWVTRL